MLGAEEEDKRANDDELEEVVGRTRGHTDARKDGAGGLNPSLELLFWAVGLLLSLSFSFLVCEAATSALTFVVFARVCQ